MEGLAALLEKVVGGPVRDLAPAGEGAWSRCYSFSAGNGRRLVLRVGDHPEDFGKDRFATRFATAALPIPAVVAMGEALGAHNGVTEHAPGTPLEEASPGQWRSLVERVADALEALRTAAVPACGWGGWDERGDASRSSWPEYLLAVAGESERTAGWRDRLAVTPTGAATFDWAYRLLGEVVDADVPRGLVHGDLLHRNVHVRGDRITGVFDWGCAAYGDHLYDLAWFEFWAPWHPNLDVPALRAALERRWAAAGAMPEQLDRRLLACHLHIGLDHLAYNSFRGDGAAVAEVEARMRQLPGVASPHAR